MLCLLTGWLTMLTVRTVFSSAAGTAAQSISNSAALLMAAAAVLTGAAFFVINIKSPESHIPEYSFTAALIVFSFITLLKNENIYAYIFLFAFIMITLFCLEQKLKPAFLLKTAGKSVSVTVISCFAVFACLTVAAIGVYRYLTYSAPGYDFGIFCNMFYNMKHDLSMTVSCERDKLLSHAAVHISPIFYLLLPIYCIFPSLVTLAVMQPLVIFSGLFPLYLLCRKKKLHNNAVMFICSAYAMYPPLATGCFYDLHENCFLTPLLLWLFYFFEKQQKVPMFVFLILTLFVKEDAFIYIAIFALYIIAAREKYLQGVSALAVSAAYFGLCCLILNRYGEGIMASRYENLAAGGTLIDSAKNILFNTGFAVGEIFKVKGGGAEKFLYAANLLLPLALIPLRCKKLARYILILPVFVNLVTQYKYQFNIGYQYSFAIAAFLFYISVLNLADMKERKQTGNALAALIAGMLLFNMTAVPKAASLSQKYQTYKSSYTELDKAIETIPDGASVTASAFLIPHLASRDIIFEDEYHDVPSTEYFVLDARGGENGKRADKYLKEGYVLIYKAENLVEIYHNENMK